MKVFDRVRVSGPLSSFVAGFAAKLAEQGYTDLSLANQLRLMAHFSRWLDAHDLEPGELTSRLVDRYLAVRRRTRTAWRTRRGLAPLLEHLGLAAAVAPTRPGTSDLVERYRRHLVDERRLSAGRVADCVANAAELLDGRGPTTLTRADVQAFVQRQARRPGFVGRLSALRSFLRFLHVSGETAGPLVSTVPSTIGWRQTALPKALEPAQVRAVLAGCDRRTAIGRRDYAAVLLMLRLGLRAGEVAALTLDDIDWTTGEVTVHGKGGTTSRLPLPVDVGAAVVAHLRRRRPTVATRAIFLGSRAPYHAATRATIGSLAGRALHRAGVSTGGGHRLRHTAATQMLHRGASLTEIAQVLRHRHVNTTAIYAKVDRDTLRSVAQPWPTGAAIGRGSLRVLAQPWPGGAV